MTNTEAIAFTALAINAGGIVWGAAKLSSAVDNLKELVNEIKITTIPEIKVIAMNVQEGVHTLKARVFVIEERLRIKYRKEDGLDNNSEEVV